ncbi:MAG: hypothetical protein RIF36_07765 [Imperialibacter sp.]|uniref:HORMA-1 domain-containing protein n=1 Tax=Imperialibacter sp. TaxID=2038411 RepID=UPI0032EC19FB
MTAYSTNSLSGTRSATDANIRDVFKKIEDDFWAIRTRGFSSIDLNWLKSTFEDIQYIALKRELEIAELQFTSGNEKWIVRYEIDDIGSIQRDNESGGIRFMSVAANANINIVIRRTKKTQETNDYLSTRGWGNNGSLQGENGEEDRAFSTGNYSATRKLTGKW